MNRATFKAPTDIHPAWLGTHKVMDLLALALAMQAVVRFLWGDLPHNDALWSRLIMGAIAVVAALDFWALHARGRFWLSAYLMPLTVLFMCCLGVWVTDASMHQWLLVSMFLVFVRLPLRAAQVMSLIAVVAAVGLMNLHPETQSPLLVRSALSGLANLILLSIFFRINQQTTRQLAETSNLLDAALATMSQGICVIGKDGRFKMCNDRARELLDLPKDMMQGNPQLAEVVKFQMERGDFGPAHSSVEPAARRYIDSLGLGTGARVPPRYLRQDRHGRYLEVQTHSMPSGEMVRTYTDVTAYEEVNRQLKAVLSEWEQLSQGEMQRGREQMIVALTELSVIRDNETGQHTKRTQMYVTTLARSLVRAGHYVDQLSPQQIDLIAKAAPMHDLGKIGIPDHILLKPGRHTDDESRLMRTHAALGESILMVMAGTDRPHNSLFRVAANLAGAHHENWDGSGYPRGLRGIDIPLEARLMALADVYDALTTARAYKRAWTHEEACREMARLSGNKFDPLVVSAFEREQERFLEIANEFRDVEEADLEFKQAA